MWAGQNFAWANRQMITHWVRQSFEKVLGSSPESMEMHIVYDVAHNVAKREFHQVEGKRRELIIHRKGATRAFPAGNPDIPSDYRDAGQPVLIPGDMGTESYLLVGTERAMKETWGSTCHGAGRNLSRAAATRNFRGQAVIRDLEKRGIIVKPASFEVAAEEAPGAYKAVREVVDVCEGAGISQKVVRLVPMGCVKG
jgi:tRNA-splicing ligase RtcB